MFDVGDIIKVKSSNNNKYWKIITISDTNGHYIIEKMSNGTTRGIWADNMINCTREYKLKQIINNINEGKNI